MLKEMSILLHNFYPKPGRLTKQQKIDLQKSIVSVELSILHIPRKPSQYLHTQGNVKYTHAKFSPIQKQNFLYSDEKKMSRLSAKEQN